MHNFLLLPHCREGIFQRSHHGGLLGRHLHTYLRGQRDCMVLEKAIGSVGDVLELLGAMLCVLVCIHLQ